MNLRSRVAAVTATCAVALVPAGVADAKMSLEKAEKRAEKAMKRHFRQAPFNLKRFDYVNAFGCTRAGRNVVYCQVDVAGYTGVFEDVSPYFVCLGMSRVRPKDVGFWHTFCMRQ